MDTSKLKGGYRAANRQEVMSDPAVHNLTKDVLRLTQGKDPVDAYYDVMLAASVLRGEVEALRQSN